MDSRLKTAGMTAIGMSIYIIMNQLIIPKQDGDCAKINNMLKLKNILRNANLLNISLIVTGLFFAWYILLPMLSLNINFSLPSAKKTDEDISARISGNLKIPSMSEYMTVSDNNLFHPERKIPVEKKAEEQPPPPPKPELVLYGTLISDDVSYAYLEDLKAPRNTPGRGRRQITMKKGDSLGGFILKDIETDKITMFRGDEKLVVEVIDTQRAKNRQASATVSPAPSQQPASKPARRLVPQTPPPAPVQPQEPSKGYIIPPRNAEEQSIFDFFDKNKTKKQ